MYNFFFEFRTIRLTFQNVQCTRGLRFKNTIGIHYSVSEQTLSNFKNPIYYVVQRIRNALTLDLMCLLVCSIVSNWSGTRKLCLFMVI